MFRVLVEPGGPSDWNLTGNSTIRQVDTLMNANIYSDLETCTSGRDDRRAETDILLRLCRLKE
jgi:hypothetical protein